MTLLIPFAVGKPLQRFPWVTTFLLILCGIGFALAQGLGEARAFREWGFVPGSFNVISLFTSLFLHAGWWHLLGNAVYLYLFCAIVEDLLGRIRFAVFYFTGGAMATKAVLSSHHDSNFVRQNGQRRRAPSVGGWLHHARRVLQRFDGTHPG